MVDTNKSQAESDVSPRVEQHPAEVMFSLLTDSPQGYQHRAEREREMGGEREREREREEERERAIERERES